MAVKVTHIAMLFGVACAVYVLLLIKTTALVSGRAYSMDKHTKAIFATGWSSNADYRDIDRADNEKIEAENADTDVSGKLKVLCWIPTTEKYRDSRLKAINMTWTRRCDKRLYFISNPKNNNQSDVVALTIPDHRNTLTDKSAFALQYIYTHYLNDFDWFLKADDDTYVIMENLKFLLSHFSATVPGYIGGRIKDFAPNGYMAGGPGYSFNSLGLKTIVEKGYRIPGLCRLKGGDEDVEVGRCAYKAGVKSLVNWDLKGKETFFPWAITHYLTGPVHPNLKRMSLVPLKAGLDCCSQLTVSFHKMPPHLILTMEFLLYRIVVNGRARTFRKGEMFSGQIAPLIDRSMKRKIYPGERLAEYYKPEWRSKNNSVL